MLGIITTALSITGMLLLLAQNNVYIVLRFNRWKFEVNLEVIITGAFLVGMFNGGLITSLWKRRGPSETNLD